MSRMALTVIALCVMALVIPANSVRADEVLDWNAHAAKAIVTVGGQVPPRALIRRSRERHLRAMPASRLWIAPPQKKRRQLLPLTMSWWRCSPRRWLILTQSTRHRSQHYLTTAPRQMGSVSASRRQAPS